MKCFLLHTIRCIAALFCTFICLTSAHAQQNTAYQTYIRRYSDLAVEQMQRHRIPASITLAQGLLESGAGRSTLATEAHNHFGIKVGSGWTGPYVVRDDDAKGEHFRKYATDKESFEDHSLFLHRTRYSSLFLLDIHDYKGWARGLKACGYATNPSYAESLIRIIENYQLYQYDGGQVGLQKGGVQASSPDQFFATHPVMKCNNRYYIIMQAGDDLENVAKMVGKRKSKLLSYNDLPKFAEPVAGNVIFLEKKRSHADKCFKNRPHIMQAGQSLHDVSQIYGIRLKSLYHLNRFSADYVPHAGQPIRVY